MSAVTPGRADDVPESVLRDRHVGSEFTRWRQAQVYTDPAGILAEAFAAGFTSAEETSTDAQDARPARSVDDCPIAVVLADGMHDCTHLAGHIGEHDFADEVSTAPQQQPTPELAAAMARVRRALEDSPTASIARREALEIINAFGVER